MHNRLQFLSLLPGLALAFLTVSANATALQPLHIAGNQLVDASNSPVTLRGVDICSLEWRADGDHILQSVQTATSVWHANIVRIPLSQDFWFGKGPGQTDDGTAYRALVRQVVTAGEADGAYVLLDLHWSDRNVWGQDIGQHKMPDEHSLAFWNSLAPVYANEPGVLFDLYNEPHDVTWSTWQNGGQVADHRGRGGKDVAYQAIGMQTLVDAVRATGAKNVIVAGGLDWAYDFSGILNGHALNDPTGSGILYSEHTYPFKGDTVAQWARKMNRMAQKYPIFVGEFGSGPTNRNGTSGANWVQQTLSVIHAQGWSFTAWSFHPTAGPSLILDWNYTPTPYFGAFVKKEIANNN